MMSDATFLSSITSSLVYSSQCAGAILYVCGLAVCLACQGETDKTVGSSRRPSILQSRSVISEPVCATVLTTVPCWCWRHWQCGHDRRLTHSFTKDTQPTDRVTLRRLCTLMFLSFFSGNVFVLWVGFTVLRSFNPQPQQPNKNH